MIWAAVLATCAGCYLLKLAGLTLPSAALDSPPLRRVADLLPIALLAALIAVQTFSSGRTLTVDARAAGLVAAAAAVLLRAPVLVVVVVAAAVAAGVRAL